MDSIIQYIEGITVTARPDKLKLRVVDAFPREHVIHANHNTPQRLSDAGFIFIRARAVWAVDSFTAVARGDTSTSRVSSRDVLDRFYGSRSWCGIPPINRVRCDL